MPALRNFLDGLLRNGNKLAYYEFAEGLKYKVNLKYKVKTEGKNPNDLLTKEEIDRMINIAVRRRDQAILSVLTESGCRVGELVLSRIKDIKLGGDFTRLTFRKGKRVADSTIEGIYNISE